MDVGDEIKNVNGRRIVVIGIVVMRPMVVVDTLKVDEIIDIVILGIVNGMENYFFDGVLKDDNVSTTSNLNEVAGNVRIGFRTLNDVHKTIAEDNLNKDIDDEAVDDDSTRVENTFGIVHEI